MEINQTQKIKPKVHDLSAFKQVMESRSHPLDMVREAISNMMAPEVGASEITIQHYSHPEFNASFIFKDNGVGMTYTGDAERPGRLDRFIGLAFSKAAGLGSDYWGWKGLGSKLMLNCSKMVVETWTGLPTCKLPHSPAQFNFEVYSFSDGRLIFKRADGKGAYWKSIDQINETMVKAEIKADVFNLKGWIISKEDLKGIGEKSLQLLKEKIGKPVDFSHQSLMLVSRIKIKDIVKEKDLFYAILYYSCGYCAKELQGHIDIEQINDTGTYRPVVRDNEGRTYTPYAEYLESFVEGTKFTIKQSIDIVSNLLLLLSGTSIPRRNQIWWPFP